MGGGNSLSEDVKYTELTVINNQLFAQGMAVCKLFKLSSLQNGSE